MCEALREREREKERRKERYLEGKRVGKREVFPVLSLLVDTDKCSCWSASSDQGFRTKDGYLVVAAGNNKQFVKVCKVSLFPQGRHKH